MDIILPDPGSHIPDPLILCCEKPSGQEPLGLSETEKDETMQFSTESVACDSGAGGVPIGTLGQEAVGESAKLQEEQLTFLAESMLCDSGSRLLPSGFTKSSCTEVEEIVCFINAGADTLVESDSSITFMPDKYFEGGNTFQTKEFIAEGGDYPFIYQTARLGAFTYLVPDLLPGTYAVDLHFVEIININGPKGMRVFNVFLQDEKVLSDFDIFSVVGANKPLRLVDSRVSIKDDGLLAIKFESLVGSPTVSGICIRRAPEMSATRAKQEHLTCTNCAAEIKIPSAQKKAMRMLSTAKYEKQIAELSELLQRKTKECYQSWMSWSTANQQLEKVRTELDKKIFQTYSLDKSMEEQAFKLTEISNRYGHDKQVWCVAVNKLEQKVKIMKQEHSQLSREAHECVSSIPDLNKMVFAVQSLVDQCEDLKLKYNEEQAKRRKLFNEVQEAKGNIRVFCRCRPLSRAEVSAGCSLVVDFEAAKDGELAIINTKRPFKFDRVYTPKDGQADVYADASPMVISVLDGYNVCIFAYGQTGTGKTFTMEGNKENRGVNYRTLEELFKISKERSDTFTYDISVSVVEVYNEQIRDLLATPSTSSSKKLEIKKDTDGLNHIPGVEELKVQNINEAWSVLQAGSSARAVGSNNVNEHSSRSHCILCIMVKAKNLITGECTKSKLWLVDLAGSERLAKTDVQGDRLKEAQNINKSLSALGDVISALANKSSHIPYRNSKLTHLLQDSLGGDSKALMFVQISPSDKDLSETLSSVNFATRVRAVELGSARKQIDTSELQRTKAMLDKARHDSKSKDESLKKLQEKLEIIENKTREKEQVWKSQQEEIKELKSQLELKMSLHSQSEKQVLQISDRLRGSEETCSTLQKQVTELEKKMREQEQLGYENYKNKVKDLENKLKEQLQESESHSIMHQLKVEEVEKKLIEQEKKSEELEKKLKNEQENNHKLNLLLKEKIEKLEEKVKKGKKEHTDESRVDETEDDLHILKSSNHINCQQKEVISVQRGKRLSTANSEAEDDLHMIKNSNHINCQQKEVISVQRGKRLSTANSEAEDDLHILKNSNFVNCQQKEVISVQRGKRLSTANSEAENNIPPSGKRKEHENAAVHEGAMRRKRILKSEVENNAFSATSERRGGSRKSDPPNLPMAGGGGGTVKPPSKPSSTAAAQRTLRSNAASRGDPVKERDSKKRIWSR
ncbi:unnamed protein product [Cuscuta epithymum]|uniref:Kinesin motor domain-containing protein n=1 Tax=Cuscuta epithymum TaxID=186058 RepID=A0AAV0FVF0_9ASTE|nr:unnamed protein product [Cuscuta epithymum]CAH9139027.1 unnamed protein product [Cuscuta epithymum]